MSASRIDFRIDPDPDLKQYRHLVRHAFGNLAINDTLKNPTLERTEAQKIVSETVIECFHLPDQKLKKQAKALIILEECFLFFSSQTKSRIPFSLNTFIKRYALTKAAIKRLSISLLSRIYFGEIAYPDFKNSTEIWGIEFLLIQISAEFSSKASLKNMINALSLDQRVRLIAFLYYRYREGSHPILEAFSDQCKQGRSRHQEQTVSNNIAYLIQGLSGHQFELDLFVIFLRQKAAIDGSALKTIIQTLETSAKNQAALAFTLFNQLIGLIIDAPIKALNDAQSIGGEFLNNNLESGQNRIAIQQQQQLISAFKPYTEGNFLPVDFEKFFVVFGFSGQLPTLNLGGKTHFAPTILDRLRLYVETLEEPLSQVLLKKHELISCISFTLYFIANLTALRNYPESYKEGFNRLAIAIATSGKNLTALSSLQTILEGAASIDAQFEKISKNKVQQTNPIFIFDQSNESLFKKNKCAINQLNTRYRSKIVHLSSQQILTLAKKLGIDQLIDTTRNGHMGYSGSRNCVFLLTPLLKSLYLKGIRSIDEMIALDQSKLLRIFHESTLDAKKNVSNIIYMIDDDMEIPKANLFAHSLMANQIGDEYLSSHHFATGRSTKFSISFRGLEDLLQHPWETFDFTRWSDIPFSIKLGEYLGKPKICFNVPFGQEESHLKINTISNPFVQMSRHLGGVRFPANQIPSHFFIGLDTHLKTFIPYAMGINLSMDLIDPSNISGKCIFPWNDENHEFRSLRDVFHFIGKKTTKEEVKRRFFTNVSLVFHPNPEKSIPLREAIDYLIGLNVDETINDFQPNHPFLDLTEKRSLTNLANLYRFFQMDARVFDEFGREVVERLSDTSAIDYGLMIDQVKALTEKRHQISFTSYPTAYGLYLLFRAAGNGEFCDLINRLL